MARGYLPEADLARFNATRASEAEAARDWAEAERCYVAAGDVDAAAAMYKRNRRARARPGRAGSSGSVCAAVYVE